jgi:hypothetical protein
MRPFKAIIALVLVAATAAGSATAAPGDAFDPTQVPLGSNDLISYVIEDGAIQTGSLIGIEPQSITDATKQRDSWKWCDSLTVPLCDPVNNQSNGNIPSALVAVSVYGPCESATQENCVESFAIGKDKDNLVQATLIRKVKSINFDPVPQYKYIGSSSISLWSVPGFPSASGTTTYAVTATSRSGFANNSFYVGDLFAGVTPYREQTGDYRQTKIDPDPNVAPENKYRWGSDQFCVFAEDGLCGVPQDFPENTYISLKIRIPNQVGGWFRGRIQDPTIEVRKISNDNNLLTVSASPVKVSRLVIPRLKSTFTDQEKIWFNNNGSYGNGLVQASGPEAGIPKNSFPFIEAYREPLKDTAAGSNTFWNLKTTAWGEGSACLRDKSRILGVVSTNATAYNGGSPSFIDGALNYKVSGLHYMPDGKTLVQGNYSLIMRSEVARCLYGFTNAPIQASVSIVGGAEANVATTVTNESKGWITMSAAGFTFSEKTIQVKFTQAAEAAAVKPPAAVAPIIKKKTTITCVKGNVSKKVTAVSPKCPAGYKKK